MDWMLANSRAVEYGTPGKIHLNALFWMRSKSSLRYNGRDKEQSPANNFKTKHNKSKNFN
jgi:hypothetical protein